MNDVPGFPGGPEERTAYDASNAVRLCDRCEGEQGVGAGADKGDRSCSACGHRYSPHVYPALALLQAERERSRGLEAALREAESATDDALAWMPLDIARKYVEAGPYKRFRASLSAVPDVQDDDDGYGAAPPPRGPVVSGADADARVRELEGALCAIETRLTAADGVSLAQGHAAALAARELATAALAPKDPVPAAGARRAKAANPDQVSRPAGGTP